MTACCEMMRAQLAAACPQCAPGQCADEVVRVLADGTVGLPVHDGGMSVVAVHYCPWCAHDFGPVATLDAPVLTYGVRGAGGLSPESAAAVQAVVQAAADLLARSAIRVSDTSFG